MSEDRYAVIVKTRIHHEGDERSRTHPGHGYPAYTSEHEEWREFKSKAEFLAYVRQQAERTYGRETYRAVKFTPISVSTKIEVEVSP